MKVVHSRVNKANLNTVPVTDGQVIYVKDTHELYFDVGNTRAKATDIIFVDTILERDSIQNPFQDKVYCVLENNKLCRYNGTTWVDLGGDVSKNYVDTNFLKKDNTTAYTPSANYNPATKKYVDDNAVTFKPFPANTFDTTHTTQLFLDSIESAHLNVGMVYLGQVSLSDMPDGITVQAEVEVYIYPQNVIYCVMRSADIPPYVWECNSYDFRGWEAASVTSAVDTSFDNTGTDLEATNVEDAILEIYSKIGDISTALDEINGE